MRGDARKSAKEDTWQLVAMRDAGVRPFATHSFSLRHVVTHSCFYCASSHVRLRLTYNGAPLPVTGIIVLMWTKKRHESWILIRIQFLFCYFRTSELLASVYFKLYLLSSTRYRSGFASLFRLKLKGHTKFRVLMSKVLYIILVNSVCISACGVGRKLVSGYRVEYGG